MRNQILYAFLHMRLSQREQEKNLMDGNTFVTINHFYKAIMPTVQY